MKLRIYSDVILSIVTKVRDLFRDKSRQLLVTIFIVTLGAIVVLGCCHARTKRNEAAALGISSELHKQMMRENPLYRHIMEESDYRTDTQQFLERIKRKRQPKELQDWARALLDSQTNSNEPFGVPQKQIPAFVLKLDPPLQPIVIVFPRSHVMVDWGGGFGHWGLLLGDRGSTNNPTLYVVEWVPGLYAYHTTQ